MDKQICNKFYFVFRFSCFSSRKKIEASENEKMKFMLENNLYSMEAKSNVIISQINS